MQKGGKITFTKIHLSSKVKVQNKQKLDLSRAGDKEQDEINRHIEETQRNIKFLIEKSNYYSRNLLTVDQTKQPTRISTTQLSPKQKPQHSPKKQLNSNSICS